MSVGKGLLSVLVAAAATVCIQGAAFSAQIDILRSVPLEISGYEEARMFPERFSTAEEVLKAIDSTPTLLIHMEAIRRAYHDLDSVEGEKLLTALFDRHRGDEKDLRFGFDHGYAQMVFKQNKTGLFFLRKANDKFKTQFSSLAYGMAEVEADLNLEDSTPEENNMRKLDATFQLSDAVKLDAASHMPGFWPTYMRVIEKMKPLPAYNSFTRKDFSLVYLPYGNSVIPRRGATTVSLPLQAAPATLLSNSAPTSCNPNAPALSDQPMGTPVTDRSVEFSGRNALIQFFNTNEDNLYRVLVTDENGQPMLSFRTYAMPNIVEDLEEDGTFEIVARQYKEDPLNPILVYRFTPCGFELDKTVFRNFR